jgi:putative CocE/NonD family hydrolase
VHLLVGPWDHEGSAEHTDRAACVQLPRTAGHRWDAYQAFFDRYLRGEDNGFGRDGNVEVFTIGRNAWQHVPAWPPPAMVATPLYLRAGGRLDVQPPTAGEEPDRYRYDPADPVDETVGRNCWALCAALGDRRHLDGRTDILTYVSEPVPEDVELTGPVTATLHAATSAIDTDFTIALCDVFADGTVNPIQDGIVRARYRDGMDAPAPIEPGRVYAYEIDLFATSYLVAAGHRIRVDVSSSCFDRYDRNPNTGLPLGRSATTVVADQAIHHGPGTPSCIRLPIVRPAAGWTRRLGLLLS